MDNFLPNLNMFGSNVFSSINTGNTIENQSGKIGQYGDL
jgi:hypothetical protein